MGEPSLIHDRETCSFGCCVWEGDTVIRYSPHPPECRYCRDDATGVDALGRPACETHIEEIAEGVEAINRG